MKKYTEVITVEVSVDSIAQQLLSNINPDFKNREILTESIIGSLLDTNKIGFIYNALHGYSNKIDFKVRDKIMCNNQCFQYNTLESKESKRGVWSKIGECVVIDINVYLNSKLKIEYQSENLDGTFRAVSLWVNHIDCSRTATI